MSRILFYLLCTLSKLNKINNQKIWILIFLVRKNFSLVKDFSHLQVSKKKTFSFSKWLQYFKIKVQLIDNWNCFWTFTQCLIVIWTVFAQLFFFVFELQDTQKDVLLLFQQIGNFVKRSDKTAPSFNSREERKKKAFLLQIQ